MENRGKVGRERMEGTVMVRHREDVAEGVVET